MITIEPEGDVSRLKWVCEEVTEVLEWVPGSFGVIRYVRPKYVDFAHEDGGVIIAARPIKNPWPVPPAGWI